MSKYYTLVTDVGRAKFANAQVTGDKVNLKHFAVGDGKGQPTGAQTELQNEVWRGQINSVSIDDNNPSWIVTEAIIPANVGGFFIREVGLYDEEGDLIVISKTPDTYKPDYKEENVTKDVNYKLVVDVTNAENVTIKIDPSVVIATRKYVDDEIKKAIGNVDLSTIEEQLKDHESKIGTYQDPGHLQLSNAVNSQSSVSDGVAATPRAVKEVNDNLVDHAKKVATKDELGHFKVGLGLEVDQDGKLNVKNYPAVYGVEIDDNNSDPFGRVKYIEDAEGFEPLYTGDGNVDLGSWGDKFPISKVKVVLMKDGEVIEELDKNDHTKTVDGRSVDIISGDSGDVMTAIPLTFWKLERVGSKLRIYVSEHKVDDDYKAYAHSRDGVVQDDYLYIGTYKGNVQDGKLRSLHDVMSTGSETIGKFRTYAEANGDGYSQQYWGALTLMQIFTVLLTKSTDSQSALGRGYVDGNDDFIKNGGTTKKGLFYGEKSGKKQMKFLGIEDFYGNRYEWVDGLATDPNRMWLINDKNTNYNDAGDGYTKHGECFDSSGYISQVDGKTNTGFIPIKTSGSSSTYYADYGSQSSNGSRVAYFGGTRSYGSIAGAFQLDVNYSASYSIAAHGARCLYLKKK